VNIEIPLFVLKLGGLFKPRYLVVQHEIRGAGNNPTVVYAELFYTRPRAVKAAQAADERLRIRIGNVSIGRRRWGATGQTAYRRPVKDSCFAAATGYIPPEYG
jgi:hypothetical protein